MCKEKKYKLSNREDTAMLKQYALKLPGKVFCGENALEKIKDILAAEGAKHVAVITDKGIRAAGLTDLVLAQIESAGVWFTVFDDVPVEPTYQQAQTLVDQCGSVQADLLIAVGGGSVMDAGKLASMLVSGQLTVKDLLETPGKAKKQVKTIMVPTTAGTGSEATPNAIVAVPEKELKVGIVNENMIADYVVLDAVMIKKLPRKIAAATGIDALAHAIECYTSNKANPLSDAFSLPALKMILQNIERACDEPDAMSEKQTMQLASFYAGIAITASGTTAVHALSYPLGGKYHIAHGVSNAILLVPVMRFNLKDEAFCVRLAEAYDACYPASELSSCEDKACALIDRMDEIVRHLDIPTSLKEFNVPESDLETLVEAGMQVTRLLVNNMREVKAEDARAIYRQIL